MFDARHYRRAAPVRAVEGIRSDELTRRCRAPAERWVLARRANRPAPMQDNLPRIATS